MRYITLQPRAVGSTEAPPLPRRTLLLVALYSLALPFVAYLALAVIEPLFVGLLLALVATTYAITGSVVLLEALAALPRRPRQMAWCPDSARGARAAGSRRCHIPPD